MPTTQAQTIAPHWEESTVQDPVSQKWKKWSMCLYCKKKFSSLKPVTEGKQGLLGVLTEEAAVPEPQGCPAVS